MLKLLVLGTLLLVAINLADGAAVRRTSAPKIQKKVVTKAPISEESAEESGASVEASVDTSDEEEEEEASDVDDSDEEEEVVSYLYSKVDLI
ncbi:unnamed protein product [Cylicocyclus nassatus]|uniref:Uncharacterized protein n=1 Tax=Cylicocyclus nassatus TaxID=53992 RepID=A0AA36HCJ7_CYLNA|nr:unnamed protein product [Cylicocyclus nassatus]